MEITRAIVSKLQQRVSSEVKFIQVVIGPRQVGKTTAVRQLEQSTHLPAVYSAADTAGLPGSHWIRSAWMQARALLHDAPAALLILDEVQLVDEWQHTVKGLWDEDRHARRNLHVVITGSSALLLKKGGESLAGRFEKHELLQWSYPEMRAAFGFSLEDFILYGGYPGAADLKSETQRWKEYIRSSLIETVLTKDIIALSNITKPSLLRQLFAIACQHPAEIVAYSNFLGQLADAGNTTTLSDYRLLLDDAYFLKTLQKFSGSTVRSRASKPKWLICDNALVTAFSDWPPQEILRSSTWGRWIENAVLNHLTRIVDSEVYYWREKDAEVDAVVKVGGTLYALEVKAGSHLRTKSGLNAFVRRFSKAMPLIVGAGGIPIEDFLASSEWRWGN